MDERAAFDLYLQGQDAYGHGDVDATLEAWEQVLEYFEREGVASLEGFASIPREMLLTNMAGVSQGARRWADMRRYAELLVRDARTAKNLQLLATALKNGGDPERAREVIEEAVRIDPGCAHAHHEHACILAAAGELDAALQAMASAIAAGSSPQSLLDDDELAMMENVPGFDEVMSTDRYVEALLKRLGQLSTTLGTLQSNAWGRSASLPSDGEIETYEDAIEVTRSIFDAAFAEGAPRDAKGRIVLAECSTLQREVIESLLSFAPLWKAIPFLNLIAEIGMPNTTVQDARRELLAN